MSSVPTLDFPLPRAAYVHVPFCSHRCGYCNFTVIAGRDDLIDTYLECLAIELSSLESPRQVDTLFLGGGTPTHLAPPQLERLLALVTQWFILSPGGEFSAEANPLDVTPARVAVLRQFGVDRISLGVQSFRPEFLRTLERDHQPDDIRRAVELAQSALRSVSLDLIFAVPGQSLEDWEADLAAALALRPQHLSTYGLTIEKGTAFWNRRSHGDLAESDEELQRAMYETGIERLAAAGFEHYEISNFAAAGHRCRHNEVYWAAHEYYAAGPGASRYVAGRRETNHRSTTTYCKRILAGQSPVNLDESEALSPADRAREAAVLGLRRLAGIHRATFRAQTGFDLDALLGRDLVRHIARGNLIDAGDRLRLSRAGLLISDAIWPDFLRA